MVKLHGWSAVFQADCAEDAAKDLLLAIPSKGKKETQVVFLLLKSSLFLSGFILRAVKWGKGQIVLRSSHLPLIPTHCCHLENGTGNKSIFYLCLQCTQCLVPRFELPQKQALRKGIEFKWFIREGIPGNRSRE